MQNINKEKKLKKQLLKYAKIAKLSQLYDKENSNDSIVKKHLEYVDKIFSYEKINEDKNAVFHYYKNKGTEFVILQINNRIYVSFNSTDFHYTDLISHALMCSTHTSIGKIHKGYWSKFSSILSILKEKVLNHNNATNLYFIGHSLGGALAQIAYLYAKLHWDHLFHSKIHCITFGSCKPIKKLPYSALELYPQVFNYYLKGDNVGLFPFGFHHIKPGIMLAPLLNKKNGKSYKDKTLPFLGLVKTLNSMFITKKHSIDLYIKELENDIF